MPSPTVLCRTAYYTDYPLVVDDSPHPPDSDQLIFGPLDLDDGLHIPHQPLQWDPYAVHDVDTKSAFHFADPLAMSSYEYGPPETSPTGSYYESTTAALYSTQSDTIKNSPSMEDNLYLSNWINDPELSAPSPSSPISIPSPSDFQTSSASSFSAFGEFNDQVFSPTSFAALHPLPPSAASSFDEPHPLRQRVNSSTDMSLSKPSWASHLWDLPTSSLRPPSLIRSSVRHSPLSDGTVRQRVPMRRGSHSSSQTFQSSSAPSNFADSPRAPSMTRAYSRRSESVVSIGEDRDATVRRKKRSPPVEEFGTSADKTSDLPSKSMLKPPKLAPSAWQLYFTDWIQKQQRLGTRKLNVAQAAKEAGQEYASLSNEEKEPYKRRSQAAKETREREHEAYMRTLTPEDIKRENVYRAAQRKAGKSRKGNIKDPNAPKKPLSAYFMFLQRIRADPKLVKDIFGDETETTKQSVLAAAKWRSMTDAERQPFLAQAEQEKMEYEAARRLYEEGTTGYGTNINFSILQSPAFPTIKLESSESESESIVADDSDKPRA
ncbi:hypothetical protein FA15DRAFT_673551 [Coprinopsis marcescibilis]|uniref:HMG box domain-containing protein n=1 Tax=Coprinopsis marcescibilis TaxID=230819 RepID=A0A5C3KJJ0_COPMA|nr:hypothetical protein FA15DRAFT_673551 [Coprinopsis marcescibilis]